jgi:hypothetical protein
MWKFGNVGIGKSRYAGNSRRIARAVRRVAAISPHLCDSALPGEDRSQLMSFLEKLPVQRASHRTAKSNLRRKKEVKKKARVNGSTRG